MSLTGGKSYLVTGEYKVDHFNSYDLLELDGRTAGIKEVREIINKAHYKSTSDLGVLIIHYADKLSADCQNTLLKLLEEPPMDRAVVLQAKSTSRLLPTITSRLQRLSSTTLDRNTGNIQELIKQFDSCKKRDEFLAVASSVRDSYYSDSQRYLQELGYANSLVTALEKGANAKLAVEVFLLRISGV